MREQILIGGQWQDGSTGERIRVLDPATGSAIASVAAGTPEDATRAVRRRVSRSDWMGSDVAPENGQRCLRNCWQTLISHTDELAELIVREHGKPMADAKGEIGYAAEFFRWNSEEAVRIHGSIGMAPSGANKIIVRPPARRCCRDGHAVELPSGDDHSQDCACARRWQRSGHQATEGDATHCASRR